MQGRRKGVITTQILAKNQQPSSLFCSLSQSMSTRCWEADPRGILLTQAEKQADFLQRDLTYSAKIYY